MVKLVHAVLGAALSLLCVSAASAAAASLTVPETPVAAPLPAGAPSRTVSLTKIVARIDNEDRWAAMASGPLCLSTGRLSWAKSGADVRTDDLVQVFRSEVEAAGYKVDGDDDNLFEEAASFSEYAVAGVIRGAEGALCFPGFGGDDKVKGSAVLDVEWQIYSRLERRVVARIQTRAGVEDRHTAAGGAQSMVIDAFAETVKALVASDEFRKTFVGAPHTLEEAMKPTLQQKISLAGPAAPPLDIGDAVGSVVLVLAGDGHGSGFLVSKDGYVMTDQHVVGDARLVTIRWPDGIETVGEVERSDRVRDVALIKTDPRGRAPLPLRPDTLRPGETVFAIGAPLEQRFQSTVTRGVVSAYRTIEGLRYLQSDVAISPGNSGGPLLDEKGEVLGICDLTFRPGGADVPSGINYFVPIDDALRFLAAEPQ
jgi:S1-C subfamily serine protease